MHESCRVYLIMVLGFHLLYNLLNASSVRVTVAKAGLSHLLECAGYGCLEGCNIGESESDDFFDHAPRGSPTKSEDRAQQHIYFVIDPTVRRIESSLMQLAILQTGLQ